jgi:pSer/pThr/pTyr-binding forkhead associated (FHA) protein
MNCRQCGHGNEPGARFCSSCGALLDGDDATMAVPTVTSDESADAAVAALAELPEGVAVLVVRRGPNAGSVFTVDPGEVAAGRHPESEIFLDDITVSRRHAVVTATGDRFMLRDLGSLNGTYVNHERVDETELQSGDEIQIGRFVLTFHTGTQGGTA